MSSVSQSTVCFNVKFIMNYKLQILFILQSSVGVSDEVKMFLFRIFTKSCFGFVTKCEHNDKQNCVKLLK